MLDYSWNTTLSLELPLYKKDIDELQQVKGRVTNMVRGWSTSYSGRLRELDLFCLENRRLLCH